MNIVQYTRQNFNKNMLSANASRTSKLMYYGTMCEFNYLNWKHVPHPTIFVMYSGMAYTHGLSIDVMNDADKQWLGRLIYLIKKGRQIIDGRTLYLMIKQQRPSIVKNCYRKYFSQYIVNPRMISAGFTPLDKLVYPTSNMFIQSLNKYLSPKEIFNTGVKVAYYDEELRDRVIMAQNMIPIGSATTPITSAIV